MPEWKEARMWLTLLLIVLAVAWWDGNRSEGHVAPATNCYVTPQLC